MKDVKGEILANHQEHVGEEGPEAVGQVIGAEAELDLEARRPEVEHHHDADSYDLVQEDEEDGPFHELDPLFSIDLPGPGIRVNFVLFDPGDLKVVDEVHHEVKEEQPEPVPGLDADDEEPELAPALVFYQLQTVWPDVLQELRDIV